MLRDALVLRSLNGTLCRGNKMKKRDWRIKLKKQKQSALLNWQQGKKNGAVTWNKLIEAAKPNFKGRKGNCASSGIVL